MRSYVYRAEFERGARRGYVVSFSDVPEAIAEGRSREDARAMAEEALGLALLSYSARGLPLPKPRAKGRRLVEIAVAPDVAAKLAVLEAFKEAGISKSELARAGSPRTRRRCAASSIRSTRPNCRRWSARCARSASGW